MVTITIFMEGGADPNIPEDIQTINNTQALRESLYRIFKENISTEVSIVVIMLHGYKNAVKKFLQQPSNNSMFLYVDLDGAPNTKDNWFQKLEDEGFNLSEEQKQRCFFMIQEMEAWILYQPTILDTWGAQNGYIRQKSNINIINDNNIAGKVVTEILHPSDVLSYLLGRYFTKVISRKKKKAKYGKLKTAPALLDLLDASLLGQQDEELKRFITSV